MSVHNGVEELSENAFEDFTSKGIVLIDFFAEWCMPCVMMSPIIEELHNKLKKIKFGKVNVDENSELAGKFKILSIPTLIVFKNGEEIERINGSLSQEKLEEKLKKLI